MVSAKRKSAAKKAWRTRKRKYGKDGLTPKGKRSVSAANRRKGRKRRR